MKTIKYTAILMKLIIEKKNPKMFWYDFETTTTTTKSNEQKVNYIQKIQNKTNNTNYWKISNKYT